jgi:outer membrane protein assembly factor BamB
MLAAALLAGCAGSGADREPPAELTDFTPQRRIESLWSVQAGSNAAKLNVRLVPRLDRGIVYTAGAEGRIGAYEAATGNSVWDTRVETALSGAIGIGGELVVAGGQKGEVVALDKRNGKRLWEARVSSEVLAPPAVGGDVVVVQSVDGRLAGFSAADGKRLWVFERAEPALSLRGTGTPVIAGDHVVAGFASGKIAGVSLRDGRAAWEIPVAQPRGRNEVERLVDVDAPILLRGDALFAVSFQGKVIAVDLRVGRIAWSRDVSSYSGMDADKSNLYVADEKGIVTAFDIRSGAVVWKQDKLHGRRLSAPAASGSEVVVGDFDGYLHWLAPEDGRFLARERISFGPIVVAPIVAGATVIAAGSDGTLAALRSNSN